MTTQTERLRATVEAGFKSADSVFWEVARSSLKGTSHLSNPTDNARLAFNALVTDYEAELKALREFVREVSEDQAYLDDMYRAVRNPTEERYAHAHASTRLSNRSRQARNLLVKSDESEVT